MRVFKVMASNLHATYRASEYTAETPEEAIEQAREAYRNLETGRILKDVGSFRFFTVSEYPDN
jgi:GTP cyclohydrolase III